MSKPRIIKDDKDLKRAINAYFDSVDKYNEKHTGASFKYYTWPDMLLFIGITESGVTTWLNNPDRYIGFKEPLERAQLRMQSQIEQTGLQDGKKTGMVAFLLKQKHYGGYTDKPISAADSINVNVNLQGMGHMDAFG